ncbi:VWA domain-containing protein [Pelagicoccus sp. SDUM812003]|uniref:vWA domain-containing protein n=1 Tax=Pelagicoccus sp. SDUM812003 TaxID=3041267 RepID=UPI0028103001|nr:VWA domain-containing protein [Pelagicoccus sp. SDUM812003]MDQ8205304.1 VWA domain-containing protein [Pelagicoccus sp. SDUM812003]
MKKFGKNDPEFTALALGERSEELDASAIAPEDRAEFEELKRFSEQLSRDLKAPAGDDDIGERRLEDLKESVQRSEGGTAVLRFPGWFSAVAACFTMGSITALVVWTNRDSLEIADLPVEVAAVAEKAPEPAAPPEERKTERPNQDSRPLSEPTRSTGSSQPMQLNQLEMLINAPASSGSEYKDLAISLNDSLAQTEEMRVFDAKPLALGDDGAVAFGPSVATSSRGQGVPMAQPRTLALSKSIEQPRLPEPDRLVRAELPNREGYSRIDETPFTSPLDSPLSTFSIDVDTASYANVRRFIDNGQLPPTDAVRIEELINYFRYDYPLPTDEKPFSVTVDSASAPWNQAHRLVRIGLQGQVVSQAQRPAANLVFLVDVSGSMSSQNKLPLAQKALSLLVDQMRDDDRIAVVVYAGSSGVALPSTTANNKETIKHAIENLRSGGSTNGASGIESAYATAQRHFVEGGINRVILCTDGDFNVGISDQGALTRLIEEKAKSGVFFSAVGFGQGNYRDDMMEVLSNRGNGNYAYIDGETEARKVFVEDMLGTLMTIAKDVKIQVEFNPAKVASYRLIGYENRALAARDFNDDKKDAGEIGSGHSVTALYEIVPAGGEAVEPMVDPLKYQSATVEEGSEELLTVKLRYKQPDADTSQLIERPFVDAGQTLQSANDDLRFAASVAAFGMVLRNSEHVGEYSLSEVESLASGSLGSDRGGYRREFLDTLRKAKSISAAQQRDAAPQGASALE